jgi:hypothetical protein
MVVTQTNWFWVFAIMSVVWAQVGGQIALALLAYFLILIRSCVLLPRGMVDLSTPRSS